MELSQQTKDLIKQLTKLGMSILQSLLYDWIDKIGNRDANK